MAVSDSLRMLNADLRLIDPLSPASKKAEVEYYYNVDASAEDPADLAMPASVAGTQLGSEQTGDAATTYMFKVPGDLIDAPAVIRVVTTVGATPTATFDVQGSLDGSTSWTTLSIADEATPTTFAAETFAITEATTVLKIVKAGQQFKYIQVDVSSNTNVTFSVDIFYLGNAGTIE